MRFSIVETTGEFDLMGYAGLETFMYGRPALVNADSTAIQSQISLGRLRTLVSDVEGVTSDEVFATHWEKTDGKDMTKRAETAAHAAAEAEAKPDKKPAKPVIPASPAASVTT